MSEQLDFGGELHWVAIAFLCLADLNGVSPTAGGADLRLDWVIEPEGRRLGVDDHVIEAGRTEQRTEDPSLGRVYLVLRLRTDQGPFGELIGAGQAEAVGGLRMGDSDGDGLFHLEPFLFKPLIGLGFGVGQGFVHQSHGLDLVVDHDVPANGPGSAHASHAGVFLAAALGVLLAQKQRPSGLAVGSQQFYEHSRTFVRSDEFQYRQSGRPDLHRLSGFEVYELPDEFLDGTEVGRVTAAFFHSPVVARLEDI